MAGSVVSLITCFAATIGLAGPAMAASDFGMAQARPCKRACLEGVVDRFLEALAARDPSRLPWAPGARFTENNVELAIGDGVWGTANGIGSPEQGVRFADEKRGQAAFFGTLHERGEPVFLALRLKIADGLIEESEVLINRRNETGARGDPTKLQHDPAFTQPVPVQARSPHGRMVDLANGYFSTLQLNDGKLFTHFDDGCTRRENGMMMAGDPSSSDPLRKMSCADQFKLGFFRFDDRVRERDFPLVDEERGIVFSRGFIDHSGRLEKYSLTDGTVRESRVRAPHAWHFLEAFKIENGRIRTIESVFIYVPYGMPSPWTTRAATSLSR